MTAAEYAQAVADHAEMLAKANGFTGAQAIVHVAIPDADAGLPDQQAVGIGTEDGRELTIGEVLGSLLRAATEISEQSWTARPVSA